MVISTADGVLGGFQSFSDNTKKLAEEFLSRQSAFRANAEDGAKQAASVAGQVKDSFGQIGSGFPL